MCSDLATSCHIHVQVFCLPMMTLSRDMCELAEQRMLLWRTGLPSITVACALVVDMSEASPFKAAPCIIYLTYGARSVGTMLQHSSAHAAIADSFE